jgi:hypothetical protein
MIVYAAIGIRKLSRNAEVGRAFDVLGAQTYIGGISQGSLFPDVIAKTTKTPDRRIPKFWIPCVGRPIRETSGPLASYAMLWITHCLRDWLVGARIQFLRYSKSAGQLGDPPQARNLAFIYLCIL